MAGKGDLNKSKFIQLILSQYMNTFVKNPFRQQVQYYDFIQKD